MGKKTPPKTEKKTPKQKHPKKPKKPPRMYMDMFIFGEKQFIIHLAYLQWETFNMCKGFEIQALKLSGAF